MDDSVLHSLEADSTDEEDDENDVGENGGDVDDGGILSDALDHAEVDQDPGGDQAAGDRPVEVVRVLDVVGDVQGLAVPVVSGRATGLEMTDEGEIMLWRRSC